MKAHTHRAITSQIFQHTCVDTSTGKQALYQYHPAHPTHFVLSCINAPHPQKRSNLGNSGYEKRREEASSALLFCKHSQALH
jgi:hypothetical protein